VPGLAAKPIIDVIVTVDDPDDDLSFLPALIGAGYPLRVIEAEHRMFRTPARDVHVHLWRVGSDDERRHLVFRDCLSDNADDRARYEAVKHELAARSWDDSNDYADAKNEVVNEIMSRAERSATQRSLPS
jgi:GrpB-like predicted nucleotidyltransferase (UPF0157 family)